MTNCSPINKPTICWSSGSVNTASTCYRVFANILAFLTLPSTLYTSSWAFFPQVSHSYLTLPFPSCALLTLSWSSYLAFLFSLSSHGLVQSTGHIQFITFTPCFGLFQMLRAILSLISTIKTFPQPQLGTFMTLLYRALETPRCQNCQSHVIPAMESWKQGVEPAEEREVCCNQ